MYKRLGSLCNDPNIIKYPNHNYNTRSKVNGLATVKFLSLAKLLIGIILSLKINSKLCHLIHRYYQVLFTMGSTIYWS